MPPYSYTVESTGPSHPYQRINVKAIMSSKNAREYAHPNERDLVVVEMQRSSERRFAIVDSHRHYFQGDNCEVFIVLKMICRPGMFQIRERVELKVVMSLTNEIRQWTGLINFHASALVRDLLNPRGKDYFCQPSLSKPNLIAVSVVYT